MDYLKLSDLIEKIIDNRGKNPGYYCEEGIPVIDNYLINNNYHPKLNLVNRYIDDNIYNSFLRGYIKHNDLLITLVGNGFGNCCLAPNEKVAIIQNTIGLRVNDKCLSKYLYYLILSNQSKIKLLNRGAAQPSIKVSDLINIEIYVHDINKQQHIVNSINCEVKYGY